MKPLVALAILLLGGVAVFLVVSSDGGRGSGRGSGDAEEARGPRPTNAAPQDERVDQEAPRTGTGSPRTLSAPRTGVEVAQEAAADSHRFFGTVLAERSVLEGARVRLLSDGQPLADQTVNERGVFEIACTVPREDLVLELSAYGFLTLERDLGPIQHGGTQMIGNVRMIRGVLLSGKVVDESDQPVPRASISVTPQSRGAYRAIVRGESDAKGEFELRDAPNGHVSLTARAAGLGETTLDLRHAAGDSHVIRLARGKTLRVAVDDGRGSPVEGAQVRIDSMNPNAPPRTAATDARGEVVFEGLAAELWNVRVTKEHHRPGGKGQVRADGRTQRVPLPAWPRVEGRVLGSDGEPAPEGTRVQALPEGAPWEGPGRVTTGIAVGADGKFVVPGVRSGRWVLHVRAPGHAPYVSAPFQLGMEGDHWAGTLRLQKSGKLELRVRAEGGPLASAEIEVTPQAPRPGRLFSPLPGGMGGRQRVDARGALALEGLGSEFWIVVRAEGFTPVSRGPFRVRPGATSGPEVVELERAARIEGRVRLGGEILPGTRVRIVEEVARIGYPLTLPTDAEGRFRTQWIPAGTYQIEILAPGKSARNLPSKTVEAPAGETTTLTLGD